MISSSPVFNSVVSVSKAMTGPPAGPGGRPPGFLEAPARQAGQGGRLFLSNARKNGYLFWAPPEKTGRAGVLFWTPPEKPGRAGVLFWAPPEKRVERASCLVTAREIGQGGRLVFGVAQSPGRAGSPGAPGPVGGPDLGHSYLLQRLLNTKCFFFCFRARQLDAFAFAVVWEGPRWGQSALSRINEFPFVTVICSSVLYAMLDQSPFHISFSP
jgi:hypothetical protein